MATSSFLMMLAIFAIAIHLALDPVAGIQDQTYSNVQISGSARKLLNNSTKSVAQEGPMATQCDISQIVVRRGVISVFPLTYTAEVQNLCEHDDCRIGNIHLNCLFFIPFDVVPPVLQLVAPGDCLLNDGKPLDSNEIVTFSYTYAFPYQFTVLQATCL